MLDFLKSK